MNNCKTLFKTFSFILLFFVFHFPFFFNQELSLIQIGDVLDGLFPVFKNLSNSKYFFSLDNNNLIENYNNQVYRNALLSPWNITAFIFYLTKNNWLAYLLNLLVINFISFIGMLLLLNKVFGKKFYWYSLFIAFSFMALPRYCLSGGAVYSLLPIVIYCFIKLYEEPTIIKGIIFFFLPCLGSVIITYPVLIFISFLYILLLVLEKKTALKKIYIPIIYFTGIVFAEINLFLFKFLSNIEFHRVIRAGKKQAPKNYTFNDFISEAITFYTKDNFNEQTSSPKYIVIFLVLFTILFFPTIIKKIKKTFNKTPLNFKYILIPATIFFIIITIPIYLIVKKHLLPLPDFFYEFDISRISSLLPSLYYITFGFIIITIVQSFKKYGVYIAFLMILLNLITVIRGNGAWKLNLKAMVKKNYTSFDHSSSVISFSRYYSNPILNNIKSDFGTSFNKTKVMSYGIHPGVLSLAGFNTVNFYTNVYPLKYNLKFREYLYPQVHTKYYKKLTTWGNRVYFMDDFLLKEWNYKNHVLRTSKIIDEPKFNWKLLKEDNVETLFSSVEFKNTKQLTLIKEYNENKYSAHNKIYIYKIK